MLAVRPNELLPIVRLIEDHTDTNTYFVRAVVKNARTLAILDTVDLTDNGSREFSKNWQTPADSVGLGLYIIITTTVYTDSGYTTKSDRYGEKLDTYKIEINQAHFGGGGDSTDYRRLRKIIQEELGAAKPEFPEIPKTDLSTVVNGLNSLAKKIDGIVIPKPEKTDLSAVLRLLEAIKSWQTAFKHPEMPEFDYDRIIKAIEDNKDTARAKEIFDKASEMLKKIGTFFTDDMNAIRDGQEDLAKKFDSIPYLTLNAKKE